MRAIDRYPVRCGGLAGLSAQARVSAKESLLATDDNVESIALACGFQGMRHFYVTFKKMTGVTPGAYRRHRK